MSKIRFVGRDGSMGLRRGGLYEVHMDHDARNNRYWIIVYGKRFGYRGMPIPYQSVKALMNNWQSPKHQWR